MRSTCFLLLLVLLLGLGETVKAVDGAATTTPRLKLFTIFSMEIEDQVNITGSTTSGSSNSGNSVVGGFDLPAIKAAKSDFILASHEAASNNSGGEVDGYESTDSKQIMYQSEHWKLIQEGSFHEVRSPYNVLIHVMVLPLTLLSVGFTQNVLFMWARFHSVVTENATACLAVAKWNASWTDALASEHAASLVAYVNGSCKTDDVVALALSSPVPSGGDVMDTLSGSTLVEASTLLHQQQYLSSSTSSSSSVTTASLPSAIASRLFLRLKDTMCIDKAATPSASTTSQEELALELCTGADCQVCKPSSLINGEKPDNNSAQHKSSSSSKKHTLVAILSCGVFLAATLIVFFMLFRGRFFSIDERSKEEKEITTNLSYVLRI